MISYKSEFRLKELYYKTAKKNLNFQTNLIYINSNYLNLTISNHLLAAKLYIFHLLILVVLLIASFHYLFLDC